MADGNSSNSMGILGVLIGAVLVIGVGYFMYAGSGPVKPATQVTIEAPKAPVAPSPAPAQTPAPAAK